MLILIHCFPAYQIQSAPFYRHIPVEYYLTLSKYKDSQHAIDIKENKLQFHHEYSYRIQTS